MHDLTPAFVEAAICLPCAYCGDSNSPLSLDRIDNTIGHLQVNVVTSCRRCNMVRGDMPIEAWLHIAPAMKTAREAGAFGAWNGPRVGGKRKS